MAIKKSNRPSFWGGLAILLSLEKWSNKEINWSRIRLFCFVGRRVVRVSGQPHNRHFHPRDKERQNRREQAADTNTKQSETPNNLICIFGEPKLRIICSPEICRLCLQNFLSYQIQETKPVTLYTFHFLLCLPRKQK
jgi:hypothetical protein